MTNKAGQTLKFGIAGLSGKTPYALKVIYRILMAMVGVWALVQPQFPEIPATVAHTIDRICLIGGPVFYAICQAFGYSNE